MATERNTCLALTKEERIDPGLPICDPHHHLLNEPDQYLLEEFLQDTEGGHRIIQTVFMERRVMYREGGLPEMRSVGETEFVQRITEPGVVGQYGMTAVAAGIVGFADLTLGAGVAPVLEAHIAAGKGRFRGVRYTCARHTRKELRTHRNPPKGLLLDSKFREGFAYLQKYGLSFDTWLYHTQLMELVDLARSFPDIQIVLNHVGGPMGVGPYTGKREEVLKVWKRRIAVLATCPNVAVKLGGFGMPVFGFGWHEQDTPPSSVELAESIAPYCHWCIEQFGVDRCMFESNFPVDKMSYSYTAVWNAFKRISKDFSPDERNALFHDTAVKMYRLKTNH
ncbi:amidohydrolase family protein [Chloroflexota bacterium]